MRSLVILTAATILGVGAHAQTVQSAQDHAAHHPAGASAPAASPATKVPAKPAGKTPAPPAAATSAPSAMQMDAMMKSMQQMHEKMMAAKTPKEHDALMTDHMKVMRDGMAMMSQMKGGKGGMGAGGGAPMSPDALGKRMDMMEMMMQMMMDREAARTAPAK